MKKQLNVLERLTIMQILPKENSFATLKIVNELQSKLGLSEDEYKEFELKSEEGKITWNEKGKEFRDIEFGEKAVDIVKEALEKLDKEKKITIQIMSIYEKFVLEDK